MSGLQEAFFVEIGKAMDLNTIRDNPGAHKRRRRIGRGIGSGRGKTSGRGGKGQTARSGVSLNGFEGGQMPLYRRLPKRGFTPFNRKRYAEISLDRLQQAVDTKKLDISKPITAEILKEAGVLTRLFDGVRVLNTGALKAALKLEVKGASRPAVAAIEAAGGMVTFVS